MRKGERRTRHVMCRSKNSCVRDLPTCEGPRKGMERERSGRRKGDSHARTAEHLEHIITDIS